MTIPIGEGTDPGPTKAAMRRGGKKVKAGVEAGIRAGAAFNAAQQAHIKEQAAARKRLSDLETHPPKQTGRYRQQLDKK